jgi:hypothetical protein
LALLFCNMWICQPILPSTIWGAAFSG